MTDIIRNPYNPQRYPLLIVISGPSGVGKDSLVQKLKERAYDFHFVVTTTSRPPREGERHGVDYFFVSKQEFKTLIEQDELIEHALVYGQYKGVPKQQVRDALDSGKDVIMRLDVQGAATVKRIAPGATLIFLSASSEEELYERLKRRHTEDEEQLQLRLITARSEMHCLKDFDYVVINRDTALDKAVNQVLGIIQAEHCRVHPHPVTL